MDSVSDWLQKVNQEIGKQARSTIRLRKYDQKLHDAHLALLKDGQEFYRDEFTWMDTDKNGFLSIAEIKAGEKKKARIISERVAKQGANNEVFLKKDFPIKIDLRRISRGEQRKKQGFSYESFLRAKIFYAEIWAQTMMKLHDSVSKKDGRKDGKICPDEWWPIAQQHRRLLKGYSSYGLEEIWEDYRSVDQFPYSYVLELDELRHVLDIIRRKWVRYHMRKEGLLD